MRSLILGAVLLGFSPIFVKLVQMGPTAVGFYRCGFAALLLFLYLGLRSLWHRPTRAEFRAIARWPAPVWWLILGAGFFFFADLFFWHRSIWMAGAGISTILANTQIFYVATIGIIFYRERPTLIYFAAVICALMGIVLLTQAPAIANSSRYFQGVLYGLATGLVYAGYIICLRKLRAYPVTIPFAQLLAMISLASAVILLGVALAEGQMRWPQGQEWLWLGMLAVTVQIVAWFLISLNIAKIPVSTSGLILTLQPVTATVLGVVLLRESLSTSQIAGGALTLAAIYVGQMQANRKK